MSESQKFDSTGIRRSVIYATFYCIFQHVSSTDSSLMKFMNTVCAWRKRDECVFMGENVLLGFSGPEIATVHNGCVLSQCMVQTYMYTCTSLCPYVMYTICAQCINLQLSVSYQTNWLWRLRPKVYFQEWNPYLIIQIGNIKFFIFQDTSEIYLLHHNFFFFFFFGVITCSKVPIFKPIDCRNSKGLFSGVKSVFDHSNWQHKILYFSRYLRNWFIAS